MSLLSADDRHRVLTQAKEDPLVSLNHIMRLSQLSLLPQVLELLHVPLVQRILRHQLVIVDILGLGSRKPRSHDVSHFLGAAVEPL